MTIKLDKSAASFILVKCTECPWWNGFADAGNIAQGWAVGAAHEQALHPGEKQAQANLVNAVKSHATR